MTQRICFRLRVRQDRLNEYVAVHEAVWPEMLDAIVDSGWQNYSLFLDDDGTLIGYFEAESLDAARERLSSYEVNTRWQSLTSEFFEALDGTPVSAFIRLREVFNLDDSLRRPHDV